MNHFCVVAIIVLIIFLIYFMACTFSFQRKVNHFRIRLYDGEGRCRECLKDNRTGWGGHHANCPIGRLRL